jgi:SOS response associated peptidase (SRAP)
MCGPFTYKLTWEELVRLYRLTLDQPARNTEPRYNVCPTDPVDTIVAAVGKRELVPIRLGLIPRWWNKTVKDAKMATFNAELKRSRQNRFFATRSSACGATASMVRSHPDSPSPRGRARAAKARRPLSEATLLPRVPLTRIPQPRPNMTTASEDQRSSRLPTQAGEERLNRSEHRSDR